MRRDALRVYGYMDSVYFSIAQPLLYRTSKELKYTIYMRGGQRAALRNRTATGAAKDPRDQSPRAREQ